MSKEMQQLKYMRGFLFGKTETEVIGALKSGLDVNTQDLNGQTMLHFMAIFKNDNLIRAILPFNPNPFIQDKDGNTPLMLLFREPNSSTYSLLSCYERLYLAKGQKQLMNTLCAVGKLLENDENIEKSQKQLSDCVVNAQLDPERAKMIICAMKHFHIR